MAWHSTYLSTPPPTSYLDSINIIIITRYDFYDLVIYPLDRIGLPHGLLTCWDIVLKFLSSLTAAWSLLKVL